MIKKPKKFKYPSQTEKRTFMQIFKELVFSLKETFYKRSLRYENISVTFAQKIFSCKKMLKGKKRKIIHSRDLDTLGSSTKNHS